MVEEIIHLDAFGITTNISFNDNQNYNSDNTNSGLSYTSIGSQYITEIKLKEGDEANLGITLINNNYIPNKNLFVFNYPNLDFTNKNAIKLKTYIENLVYSTCYIDTKNKKLLFSYI